MTSPITIRPSRKHEDEYLKKWLHEPGATKWFPMENDREIDDAVKHWMSYIDVEACFTAEYNLMICGMANLYIPIYKKLAHQCLLSIIVGEAYRGKGVGKALMSHLEEVARKKFQIEFLHLEVYDGNPAKHLYEKMGYTMYGRWQKFIKEDEGYADKILMEKKLV